MARKQLVRDSFAGGRRRGAVPLDERLVGEEPLHHGALLGGKQGVSLPAGFAVDSKPPPGKQPPPV